MYVPSLLFVFRCCIVLSLSKMSSYNVCYVLAGIFGIARCEFYQLCRKIEAMKLQYHLGF